MTAESRSNDNESRHQTKILVVDDDPMTCQLLTLQLEMKGNACAAASDAEQVLTGRTFAFTNWPTFDRALWDTLRESLSASPGGSLPRVFASDRDAGAIRAAQANAERAGVEEDIEFSRRPVSSMDPPAGPGWIVTNPPYGKRLSSNRDLRNLYAQMGNTFRSKCPRWRVAILCDSVQLVRATRLELNGGISTTNGGLKVRLFVGHVH